jgi:hypothetical protein
MSSSRIITILLVSGILKAGESVPAAAEVIMARVAENQDRAMKLRAGYIYQQHVVVATRRINGKLARQEAADYLVTPTPSGIEKTLQKLEGRYVQKGKTIEFKGEPVANRDSLDAGVIDGFRKGLLDEKSRDGLAHDLFPLTAEDQKQYRFEVAGEQVIDGRRTYRIRFRPADKDDITWAGEALIDAEEYQPVSVYTKLSRRIPVAVRMLLGTDLPGLGFNVRYQRLDKDIWFPVSFGTEFRMHILFFLNRDITVSSENSGFRHATVESKIEFATP